MPVHIMADDAMIEPMTEELLLWRRQHHGPPAGDTIDRPVALHRRGPVGALPPAESSAAEQADRTCKVCAVVARDGLVVRLDLA